MLVLLPYTTTIGGATSTPTTFIDDNLSNNFTAVVTIIRAMHLTSVEYETLSAYMSGLSYIEIARLLNVNRTTIWRRRKSLCKKYLQITNRF